MSTIHAAASAGRMQVAAYRVNVVGLVCCPVTGAGSGWLHIFDQVAEPQDDATPTFPPIPVDDGVYYESSFRFECKLGCWICFSSTEDTLSGAAVNVRISANVA